MKRYIAVSLLFPLLASCKSWFVPPGAVWPWSDEYVFCSSSTCDDQAVLMELAKAQRFCRQVNNYYEAGQYRLSSGQLAVRAVGAVAGLVVAPMASGSGQTIASNIAGAANASGTKIGDAYASTFSIKIRAEVDQAADAGFDRYSNSQSNHQKIAAALNMARDCATSSAKAEIEMLKAVSQ